MTVLPPELAGVTYTEWATRLRADLAESLRATILRGARPVPIESAGVVTTGPGTLMGLNLTAGDDEAVVRLYDGERPDLNGDPIATVRVPAGQTRSDWFGPAGISVQRGLYVAAGAQVGLVVANTAPELLTNGDLVLGATLADAGYSVTLVDDAAAPPAGLDCFVLTESGSPANHTAAGYPALAVPVVTLEIGGWDELGMSTVNGTTAAPNVATWDTQPHATTAALPDPLTPYGGLSRAAWGADAVGNPLGAGAEVVALHPSVPAHRLAFAYEAGAAMVVGNAPARRFAAGIVDSNADDLGPEGKALLLAGVAWSLGGAGQATGFAYMRGAA